jgi:hypothetical protein
MPDAELKRCRICKERKPVDAFYRDRSRRDGLQSYCKECNSAIEKKRRRNPVERARSVQLKAGRLVKPESCEACGAEGPLEGHHDDYSKPLVIRWLCTTCHLAEHGKEVHLATA